MEEVRHLFATRGSAWYGGEAVSQLQHALQAATFAERSRATPELIVAALLHDVGHLLHDLPEDADCTLAEWTFERCIPRFDGCRFSVV